MYWYGPHSVDADFIISYHYQRMMWNQTPALQYTVYSTPRHPAIEVRSFDRLPWGVKYQPRILIEV